MQVPKPRAFIVRYPALQKTITTPVKLSQPYDPSKGDAHLPAFEFIAIWDTGATCSVITKAAVQKLGISPYKFGLVHGVHGAKQVPCYFINIMLPNSVGFAKVSVTECEMLSDGIDVLIGMDIIGAGDFLVTNFNGRTTFSFRIPSIQDGGLPGEPEGLLAKSKQPDPVAKSNENGNSTAQLSRQQRRELARQQAKKLLS